VTAADKKEFQNYLRWIADHMGLRDWHFELFWMPGEEMPQGGMDYDDQDGATAPLGACSPTPGQREAHLYFDPRLRKEKRGEVREVVVHELLHCHFMHLREHVRTGLTKHLSQSSYDIFTQAFDMSWEYSVDAIARAWSMDMPLIKWPAKKKTRRR
jgi:hypothetical protein